MMGSLFLGWNVVSSEAAVSMSSVGACSFLDECRTERSSGCSSGARRMLARWTDDTKTPWSASAAPFQPNTCADPSAVDKPNSQNSWEITLIDIWPERKHQ
ncbi:hypothetical protein GQ55_3G451500 [Panicum hallii var. hallii]|uniref:Secreted protein n=1 Tax=Panicum hallii var. hallii TaxID=1504633 RepID=A0A2T7EIH3_9POAL|nr:hypothetical protein GQ55_3G451500 [Panicum hallii var. hallii]